MEPQRGIIDTLSLSTGQVAPCCHEIEAYPLPVVALSPLLWRSPTRKPHAPHLILHVQLLTDPNCFALNFLLGKGPAVGINMEHNN